MHASDAQLREIPLDKLAPSPANVRRTDLEAGLLELAASIAAHGLLQPPVVTPERDDAGQETGRFLVTAGERRRKALLLLVKDKRLTRTAPIRCLVRSDGNPVELSLAENTLRLSMHPADQLAAFARLHQDGLGLEDIAARFGVTPAVVKQRLELAAVSPALLERYRQGELSLAQLMAFTLTDDHARQERALADLGWNKSPEAIRRLLTQGHVATRDRRVAFVGLAAYEAAGGAVLRDLFSEEEDGWLLDPELLDRLVREKLAAAAEAVREEGWRWVEAQAEYPYPLAQACRRVHPRPAPLSDADQARHAELLARYETLAAEHEGEDELPEGVSDEIDAITAELAALEQRGRVYRPEEVALAGAIVSLGADGALRIERGFVKRADEPSEKAATPAAPGEPQGATVSEPDKGPGPNGLEGLGPLPETLLAELAAHRTAALQACLAEQPGTALVAVVHALALRLFYDRGIGYDLGSCLRLEPRPVELDRVTATVAESRAGQAMAERHAAWAARLPQEADALWGWLLAQNEETRLALLAYGVARTLDATRQAGALVRSLAHADRLAETLGLDMAAWWAATRASYLDRVPKARILQAVREAVSEEEARNLAGLKKDAMATQAERLLAGRGWLPEVLRSEPATPAATDGTSTSETAADAAE